MRAVRMAFSPARPSRLKKPPGILPAAYMRSSTSTVSGKKSAPPRPSVRPTAVASTTVSPCCTSTAPCACLATTPVSKLISFSPTCAATRVPLGSTAMLLRLFSPRAPPRGHPPSGPGALAAQPELLDEGAVALQILLLHVGQKPAPAADQLQQAAARMVVVRVGLHVPRQLADPTGQERHLHFRRAGVLVVRPKLGDQLALLLLGKRHPLTTSLPSCPDANVPELCGQGAQLHDAVSRQGSTMRFRQRPAGARKASRGLPSAAMTRRREGA